MGEKRRARKDRAGFYVPTEMTEVMVSPALFAEILGLIDGLRPKSASL